MTEKGLSSCTRTHAHAFKHFRALLGAPPKTPDPTPPPTHQGAVWFMGMQTGQREQIISCFPSVRRSLAFNIRVGGGDDWCQEKESEGGGGGAAEILDQV